MTHVTDIRTDTSIIGKIWITGICEVGQPNHRGVLEGLGSQQMNQTEIARAFSKSEILKMKRFEKSQKLAFIQTPTWMQNSIDEEKVDEF